MGCFGPISNEPDKSLAALKTELAQMQARLGMRNSDVAALVSILNIARGAISCLSMDAMGFASAADGEQVHWPIRDELLHRIDETLREVSHV